MRMIDELIKVNKIDGNSFMSFDLGELKRYDGIACGALKADVPPFILPVLFDSNTSMLEMRYSVPDTFISVEDDEDIFCIEEVLGLYDQVLKALDECGDWFLLPNCFCFDDKYVYIDKFNNELKMLYIPDALAPLEQDDVKHFLISLLEKCDETSGGNIQLQLYKYFYKPKFDLIEFRRMLDGYLETIREASKVAMTEENMIEDPMINEVSMNHFDNSDIAEHMNLLGLEDESYQSAADYEESQDNLSYDDIQYTDNQYDDIQYSEETYNEPQYTDDQYEDESQYNENQYVDKQYSDNQYVDKQYSDNAYVDKQYSDSPYMDKQYADKQYADKQYADKQYADKQYVDKQYVDKQYADKQYVDKQYSDSSYADKQYVDKQYSDSPYVDKQYADRTYSEADKTYTENENVEEANEEQEVVKEILEEVEEVEIKRNPLVKERIKDLEEVMEDEEEDIDDSPRTYYAPKANRAQLSQEEIEEMVKSLSNNGAAATEVSTEPDYSHDTSSESEHEHMKEKNKETVTVTIPDNKSKNLFDNAFVGAKSHYATDGDENGHHALLKLISMHARYDLPKQIDMMLEDKAFIIGRGTRTGEPTGADYEFSADITPISRLHAQVEYKEGAYYIQDLGSSNGTFLNGAKLEAKKSYLIEDGDKVAFAIAYSKNSIEYAFVE